MCDDSCTHRSLNTKTTLLRISLRRHFNYIEIRKDNNMNTILGLKEENNFLTKPLQIDILFDRM